MHIFLPNFLLKYRYNLFCEVDLMETRIKRHGFHKAMYVFLRTVLAPFLKLMYSFHCKPINKKDTNYIVLANHVTAMDPLLVCTAFKQQMYLVGSEHLMQKGLPSKLLKLIFDPIVRQKGGSALSTVKEMLACLKLGYNVCIFPEGTCSYSGINSPMLPTIGKLVKTAGKTLVTYRLEGGFFELPRWGITQRHGRFEGKVAGIYSPEDLAAMSAKDINDLIIRDLSENAYERQEKNRQRYRSNRRAEALESSFFICPKCGKIGSLYSKGNELMCSCGVKAEMDEYGYLHDFPFETLIEWDKWQTDALAAKKDEDGFMFYDKDAVLTVRDINHKSRVVTQGELKMDVNALTVEDIRFDIADISGIELVRRNVLVFTANGEHYQVKGDKHMCTRKYMMLYKILKGERVI